MTQPALGTAEPSASEVEMTQPALGTAEPSASEVEP
ncbi:hypothetical protein ABIA39_002301 [Nocardia sp. GAS34]